MKIRQKTTTGDVEEKLSTWVGRMLCRDSNFNVISSIKRVSFFKKNITFLIEQQNSQIERQFFGFKAEIDNL